jgi:hypothetical protein
MPVKASIGHAEVQMAEPLREEEGEGEGGEEMDEWLIEDLDEAEDAGHPDFHEDGGEYGDDWLDLELPQPLHHGEGEMEVDSGGGAQRSPERSLPLPTQKRAKKAPAEPPLNSTSNVVRRSIPRLCENQGPALGAAEKAFVNRLWWVPLS